MPKIVNYIERKEEIAKESIKVFIDKGYYETKLSDIANKCGIGRTTLYQYFKNKDEIFKYAINHTIDSMRDSFEKILENSNLTFIEKIKKIIYSLAKEYKYNNSIIIFIELWLILKRENKTIGEEIQNRSLEIRELFKELVSHGIKANEIIKVDCDSMGNTLYALVESFVLQLSLNDDFNIDDHLNNVDILIDGLRK
ncbi:TetR/AcrR family transcriptional regulator [Dethiothermospora halolimnae]|uniref:TetR/AcrR family transcriptional regulator n=1 Tax=Dethiothermospora halolimnae TaxID=3114390 RepID=UPI003CCB826F